MQLALDNSKTEYPLDVQKIIDNQIYVENLKDAISRMEKLQEEFGF